MIQNLKEYLKDEFPDLKFLGYIKQPFDSMVVLKSVPAHQSKQITKQSRVNENIGFLFYDKNKVQCENNYKTLRDFFLNANPRDLAIPNEKIINTTIGSGGEVGFDEDQRLIYELTVQFEKEM
ncbi:hypothetical protein [Listeria booriae]|uniref:Uncharacterized protein n=1 Tax=Listeria booriae TaxID=1552123 RepID=A0A841W5S2_9LIST|nr:hypothetical protein [Listeria booriae]MBC1231493.1 hypothetical protein [Listeria booriae]MBC1801121.1 hypothetical protein [Listeria booriae]MBC2239758.1 hypothetical protein [Listeria booriae]